jgi:hypothetical protein
LEAAVVNRAGAIDGGAEGEAEAEAAAHAFPYMPLKRHKKQSDRNR